MPLSLDASSEDPRFEPKPILPPLPPRAQALREMIAMRAMQGLLANEPCNAEAAAAAAVLYADALIAALAKPAVTVPRGSPR